MSLNKRRGHTIYAKAKGSDTATGVEIAEWEKRDEGETEGRVSLRFFVTDGSKETIRFVAEPPEAFDLYCKINKVARSETACKEQTLPHKSVREEGRQKFEMVTSVTVERWVRGDKSGYAIVGSRTSNGKANSINVSVAERNRLLYYGELLRFLSCSQSWEKML